MEWPNRRQQPLDEKSGTHPKETAEGRRISEMVKVQVHSLTKSGQNLFEGGMRGVFSGSKYCLQNRRTWEAESESGTSVDLEASQHGLDSLENANFTLDTTNAWILISFSRSHQVSRKRVRRTCNTSTKDFLYVNLTVLFRPPC